LDFYTEVQDLSHLETALSQSSPRYTALNMAICSLIEDFGLVGFETLAVEDKESMLHLTRAIDKATGYVFVPPPSAPAPPGTVETSDGTASGRPNALSLLSTAAGPMRGPRSDVRDVQERWIDAKEEYDAWERAQWRSEGQLAQEQKARDKIRMRGRGSEVTGGAGTTHDKGADRKTTKRMMLGKQKMYDNARPQNNDIYQSWVLLQPPEDIFTTTSNVLSLFCPSVSLCFVQLHNIL